MSFEELGPTFVKLGQVLATRPDLVPDAWVTEFEKLHDKVNPLKFETVEAVLREEFGDRLYQIFESFEQAPLGSASIAQVHLARLKSGEKVVIKVQRPNIIQTINDDLHVLYFLAELLQTYIPETRSFNPVGVIDEYFKSLELETNFVVEANNLRRMALHFKDEADIRIPKVYFEYTTERVLVMEAFEGLPLSSDLDWRSKQIDPESIVKKGLKAYLKMVFIDGFFHGDLHAGNFFVLSADQIGLVDLGVVGRLNTKTQTAIANMLLALAREDYERLAYEYVDLAPFTDQVNIDLFAKDLRNLIAPYYGLTLKNINLGKILMSTASVASKHHLTLPTELMLFFKSLVSIEGLARKIIHDFDFLTYSQEFAKDIAKDRTEPQKIANELAQIARESKSFLHALPRQMHFLVRKLNSPDHAFRWKIEEMGELKKSIELSFNLLFLGVIIAALIMSASFIYVHDTGNHVAGFPTLSLVGYLSAMGLSVVAFINYIRK